MRMLGLISLVMICANVMAAEIELVDNGDFESADAVRHWSASTWSGEGSRQIDADVTHSGKHSLRLTGESDDATVVTQQSIPLVTSEALTLSGFWRSDVQKGIGGRVILRWIGDGGAKLRDEQALIHDNPFDWTPFELTVTPPEGAAGAIVFLEIWESRGNVWFDEVSATQTIEPPDPAEFAVGRSPDVVTVGVFDANAAGGRGFGAQGIQDALAETEGVRSELITDLSLATLGRFDCVALPNVHDWGGASATGLLGEHPELAWAADPRVCLEAYVRMGGGLVLTHQSNGSSPALSPSILPQIVSVPDKTTDTAPVEVAEHPVTSGVMPLAPTFADARVLQPGPAAEVLMRNKAGQPLVVAGEMGEGRVVGIGYCPGINPEEKPITVSAGEARLMANAVRWAGADSAASYALTVSPDTFNFNTPGQQIELTVSALPSSVKAPQTVKMTVVLLNDSFTVIDEVAPIPTEVAMGGSTRVVIPDAQLEDGTYYVALRKSETSQPEVVATVENHAGFARWADTLPKANFDWAYMNVHGGVGGLDSEEKIAEMAQMAKDMHFDAVLFAAKPPSGYLYYNTTIGEKAPGFEDIDPLALAVKHCHALGLQILVQFCTFSEGSANNPSKFMREHPEWADWDPGDGPDLSKQHNGVFGCPDRPEVRAYELSLMREMAENYDIDGFSFDYIRYKNDRWCVCPFSQEHFKNWWAQHQDLSEGQARAKHAEEQIVSFTWEVRQMLDEVKPEAILHGYVHPTWANRFPLNYLSFRASAHWTQPGRGGPWSLERVHKQAAHNVDLADDYVDFMQAAPMADTGYVPHAKPADRFRRELRLISDAGAKAVMIYLYGTLRQSPELRQVIAEELAE